MRCLFLASLFVCTVSSIASGTTYVVRPDGTGDFPTIQAAVDSASNGDVIELTDGTFRGVGNRAINLRDKRVVVRSAAGDPAVCVIDCENVDRGFASTYDGSGAVLEAITIRNGSARGPWTPQLSGGGMYLFFADPLIVRCVFESNFAVWHGGAIMIGEGAEPTLVDCTFVDNSALYGGAIFVDTSTSPTMTGCTLRGNAADVRGGAIFCHRGTARITDCLLLENTASAGGGLSCWMGSRLVLDGCTLYANDAISGSGICGSGGGEPILRRLLIVSGRQGAAVDCDAGSLVDITCCDVYGNAGGDWVGCLSGQENVNGNFSRDPLFCDPLAGDFRLMEGSPCLPESHPAGTPCGQIGAFGEGCGATPVLEVTWGRIKGQFRR